VQVLGQLRQPGTGLSGTIGLFAKLHSTISPAFLQRFPTVAKAARLSLKRLASSVAHTGGVSAGILHDRLAAAVPGSPAPRARPAGRSLSRW
jgi:hypothetical protein